MNQNMDIFNPTEAHAALREHAEKIGHGVLEPQAKAHDDSETFNEVLLRKFGSE